MTQTAYSPGFVVVYSMPQGIQHGRISRTRKEAERLAAVATVPTEIVEVSTHWPEASEAPAIGREAA